MARGKHSAAAAAKAQTLAAVAAAAEREACAQLKVAQQEVAKLTAEVKMLRAALIEARRQNTLPGTHTETEVAQLLADAKLQHRESIKSGFALLSDWGVPPLRPGAKVNQLAAAFDCEVSDFFATMPDVTRIVRRLKRATLNTDAR
jgi:hypothetical protein